MPRTCVFVSALLTALFLRIPAAANNSTNSTGDYFREFYSRAYALRTLNGSTAHPRPPPVWEVSVAATKAPIVEASIGINWANTDRYLDEIYEKYETLVRDRKLAKIAIEGNAQETIDFAADQIYERSAGRVVDMFMEKFGDVLGADAGRFVGGEMGLLLGILFPEIEVPLVLGGVFLGSNLGKALGHVVGQIGGSFVNDLIEEKILNPVIDRSSAKAMSWLLGNTTQAQSTQSNVTCNSNICEAGEGETGQCQCRTCNGAMEYQDQQGQVGCKHCEAGYRPFTITCLHGNLNGYCGCQACSRGQEGTGNPEEYCRPCKGQTYQDHRAQTECKVCPHPKRTYPCMFGGGNCACQ